MSYSNGLLPTSSSTTSQQCRLPGLPGVGFKLTDDGNYYIDGKLFTNVGEPTGDGNATTKKYVDQNKSNKSDVILRDGSQNMTGNLDFNGKK